MLIALASALKGLYPPTPSTHRLRLGLPGYLIRFAPLAPDIYAFYRYTGNSTPSCLVSHAISELSPEFSHETQTTTYAPFTPSESEQRSGPTFYRGCWHVVSRPFLLGYRPSSSPSPGVYAPKDFFLHAASLGQAFAHCPRFPAAASRRSLGRVSVPSRYLTVTLSSPVSLPVNV